MTLLQHALSAPVASRAARVAVIVGTGLIAINHGDTILAGTMTTAQWIKCMATYLVPYLVSTYSSAMALRDRDIEKARP